MRRHVYHFHAEIGRTYGDARTVDGIARMIKPIVDMDDYALLKGVICNDIVGSGAAVERTVITSLSHIGMEDDDPTT